MTTLDEIQAFALAGAKALKEAACRNRPRDIQAMIDVYRGDELVAQVIPRQHQRDLILQAFRMSALGFDADAMALIFESYTTYAHVAGTDLESLAKDPEVLAEVARRQLNPVTGKPWRDGEMHDVVHNHRGLEQGWVVEALSVSCANRAGDVTMAMMPYRYSGKHLVWMAMDVAPAGAEATGTMPEAMVAAMDEASMGTLMPYAPGDLPRAERDVMAAQAIMETIPCQVALLAGEHQKDRVRVLKRAGIQL